MRRRGRQNKRRPCEAPSNEPAVKRSLESLRAGNRGNIALVEADVVELAGIGHMSNWEAPDRFNDAVLAFLAEASRA